MKHSYLVLVFLLFACARQVPLTGGLKDLDAPKLVTSQPGDNALNFDGQKIVLEFDEYIKQENLLNQLIITPRIKGNYKTKLNKNILTLDFEEPFDSATTYTLNFREGIKDITEGNVPPNLKFVFSTGSYLDSISISGEVRNLLTQEALEDITISLYRPDDTVTVFNGTPQYLAKSDKDGTYSLQNIKNGSYLIYAINDDNQNIKLETRTESYGFLDAPESLQDSTANLNFQLLALDNRNITLISSRPVGKNFDIFFNKSLKDYRVTNSVTNIASNLIEENRNLRLYKTGDMDADSIAFQFQAFDSLGQSIDTLVYARFQDSDRKTPSLSANFNLKDQAVDKKFTGQIKLNKPIGSINGNQIMIKFDSLNTLTLPDSMLTVNNTSISLNIDMDALTVNDSILSTWSKPFQLLIPKGTIFSVEQDTVPDLSRDLTFKNPEEFGLFAGTINTTFEHFLLELTDDKFERVQHLTYTAESSRTFLFAGVTPGEYSLRVFIDLNGNGVWDPGNINEAIPPEPVKVLNHPNVGMEKITIRANWEQRDVNISF